MFRLQVHREWPRANCLRLQDRSPEALAIDLEETHQAFATPQDPNP